MLAGPLAADDHINLKLQSDGQGVYAVIKTSNKAHRPASGPAVLPFVVLLAQQLTGHAGPLGGDGGTRAPSC